MCTHTCIYSHTHTHTLSQWCPDVLSAILHSGEPWCWWTRCGGSSAQQWGWRRLSCVPRAGMWKVWKQRAQLQARVFRQSVLSLMLRLVPHYKQQQAALILSLVQKCRHSRQSSCRCLQGSCVTDPWCQPGHRAGESHTILPPLSLKFPSVPESNTGNCLHDPGQLPTWVEPLNRDQPAAQICSHYSWEQHE